MKHVKLFEEYDPVIHKSIEMTRKLFNNKKVRKILDILSIIDDVVHFDFKNIRNTFKNKEGFKKASMLASELGLLMKAMGKENGEENEIFYNIRKYGFDIDIILNYLEDDDVIKYLEVDKRFAKRLDDYKDGIDFLKRYKEWNDKNNLIMGD